MRYLSFWALLLLTSPLVFAQTSLNTGDLAFTVKNLDDSGVPSFGFMTMVNLSSGTVIKFTDHGWDGSTFFNISEGELTLTLSTSVDAGGQIMVNKESGKAFLMDGTTQVGTVVQSGGGSTTFDMSSGGDQIFAFQGTLTSSPTMIAGIHSNGNFPDTNAGNNNTWTQFAELNNSSGNSMNHDDLTNNLHSFSLNTENDNHRYKASANHNDTQANLLAAINNIANWEKDSDNATPFLVPSAAFTVIGGDSDPPVVNSITLSGSPSSTATSVDFTVAFDEDATDVTTDDFELTKTGSATGAISVVSGTGTSSITVTVNSITGAGTLRLDLKANTNIIDGSGNGNNNNGYVAAFNAGTAHTVDNQPTVTLSATNTALSESATGTLGTITATLSHSYTANVTVNLSTSGATSGSDFNLSSSSIVISSGTTGSATITILDDSEVEGTETLTVSIASVSNGTESGSQSKDFTIANNDFSFSLKVFLEGALSGSTMSISLNSELPTTQPYNSATAETSSGIPASAVDWVEVELRTGSASGTKVGTNRAGILKNDGSVVDKDGSAFTMSQASGVDYFIVIRHRNHLSVMSASAVGETNGVYTYDFTTAQAQTFNNGSDGAKQVGTVFAMLAGDADGDGDIDTTDLTTWRGQNGSAFSYNSTNGDFNLDGVINAVDRIEFQKKNISKTTQVPST